ncbi:hypothetical protein [Microcoleus phage My-WqHQDG]|nr:hypothetical protein [Microcoleus phage My-WqHQDG]
MLVNKEYLLLTDGQNMSVIKLSPMIVLGIIDVLESDASSVIDDVLTISHTTKGDPYMEGLQLSVTHSVKGIRYNNGVSVFLSIRDSHELKSILVNRN